MSDIDPRDPYITAWSDQFGALLRDKVRAMIEAVKASGFRSLAHVFKDPFDDDMWRLFYEEGEFYLVNLETGNQFQLDLPSLGIRF